MYLNDWNEKRDMVRDFSGLYRDEDIDKAMAGFEHVDVLLASYSYENYSGDAFVLFRDTRDGQLYEVHGGHCSCYGLEDQWSPELCDLQSLKHRLEEGNLGCSYSGNEFSSELAQVLSHLETEYQVH